jgi:hypothetical protein
MYDISPATYKAAKQFNMEIFPNKKNSHKKLSITSRWALMAARGWVRLIFDRRT